MSEIIQYSGDEAGKLLAEIVDITMSKPDGTLNDIETALRLLHARHEALGEHDVAKCVVHVWNDALALYQASEAAITMAEAAKQVAITMNQQREAAIQQHENLTTAIKRGDRNHHLVNDLISGIELDAYSDAYAEAYDSVMNDISYESYVIEDAWEELVNGAGIPLHSDHRSQDAYTFMDILTGRVQISTEVAQMIADAIHNICRAVDAENGVDHDAA